MAENNKALKAGIGYTVGNILIKGTSFLTLPLFSRIMSTENFGTFSVFLSFDSILFVIVGLALHSSIRNANLAFKNKIDEYVSSLTLIYIFNFVILLVCVIVFKSPLIKITSLSLSLLILLVVHSFCSAILTLYNTRISIDYSYFKYLIVALCNSLGNVGISLLFMLTIFKGTPVFGRVSGVTITASLIAGYVLFYFYKRARPVPVREYWKYGIKYSLPIIPHGVSQVLLAQFDRIMINSMVSAASAGIYSLAGNLKIILAVISDSVSTAWTTWFYEQAHKNNIKSIQKRAVLLSFLFLGGAIILCGISPELILLLGGDAYADGKYVAVPMIMDAYVLFLYNIIVPSEYYKEKTIFIMLGTFFAAILNIITNYVFIAKYGYIAAAYTTLFSYVCYLVLHIIISRKVFGSFVIPIQYVLLFFLVLTVVSVGDLLFINIIGIRYLITIVIGIPIILYSYLKYKRLKKDE